MKNKTGYENYRKWKKSRETKFSFIEKLLVEIFHNINKNGFQILIILAVIAFIIREIFFALK